MLSPPVVLDTEDLYSHPELLRARLLQGIDGAYYLYPSAEKGIRTQIRRMGEWVFSFGWQGLDTPLKINGKIGGVISHF